VVAVLFFEDFLVAQNGQIFEDSEAPLLGQRVTKMPEVVVLAIDEDAAISGLVAVAFPALTPGLGAVTMLAGVPVPVESVERAPFLADFTLLLPAVRGLSPAPLSPVSDTCVDFPVELLPGHDLQVRQTIVRPVAISPADDAASRDEIMCRFPDEDMLGPERVRSALMPRLVAAAIHRPLWSKQPEGTILRERDGFSFHQLPLILSSHDHVSSTGMSIIEILI